MAGNRFNNGFCADKYMLKHNIVNDYGSHSNSRGSVNRERGFGIDTHSFNGLAK